MYCCRAVQWYRRVGGAWCQWRLKLSSSQVLHRRHLTSTASPAAVPGHILGVLKLPPDNASTSVYSTLLPRPCRRPTDHVTVSHVDNMATCWRSWTRGTCQYVVEVELSYVKVMSASRSRTMYRLCQWKRQSSDLIFLSKHMVNGVFFCMKKRGFICQFCLSRCVKYEMYKRNC